MSELDENMMIRKIPVLCYRGDGGLGSSNRGYLFQGCYSTASAAADDIVRNLQ